MRHARTLPQVAVLRGQHAIQRRRFPRLAGVRRVVARHHSTNTTNTTDKMNDQQDQQTDPPAETQSAVEWVRANLTEMCQDDGSGNCWMTLSENDALELARRCDEWERQHGHEWVHRRVAEQEVATFKANNRYQRGFHDGEESLRAQLAAAQAEVGRLREACQCVLDWYDRDGSVGMASSCIEDMRDTLDALKEGQP